MTEDDTHREQGVDFTDIDPLLEELAYPISTDELLDRHGDETIERTNAEPISLRELFTAIGAETFESVEEVRQGVLNVMPKEAVGREDYTDRGGYSPETHDESADEEESF